MTKTTQAQPEIQAGKTTGHVDEKPTEAKMKGENTTQALYGPGDQVMKRWSRGFPSIINGAETANIRLGVRDIHPGKMIVESTEGDRAPLEIFIHEVKVRTMKRVSEVDLNKAGFGNTQDAINQLQDYYPGLDFDTMVTVVSFQFVEELK